VKVTAGPLFWLLPLAGLALGACTARPAVVRTPPSCTAESLLTFSERLGALSPREADAAHAEARAAYQRTGSDCDRLRLALLLGHPEAAGHRDDGQAQKLLSGYLTTRAGKGSDPGVVALARYAAADLGARVELDARWRAAVKKTDEERTRADTLQRKIDELKQIEELLQQRQRN
jgi:hypothetical protein